MKLCSSLIGLTIVVAQDDRWGGSQDYYSLNYGFGGGSYGKNDGGLAAPVAGIDADLHHNGLYCWMCDERLDLGTETESSSDNAYLRCLQRGGLMKCRGEQRTCMFEERRRHGIIYSVCTGCKQTDACVAGWRRNQRFTLPFMNFGDMSIQNLRSGRPIYVDDECSTFQETRDSEIWERAGVASTVGDEANQATLNQVVSTSRTNMGLSYAKFSYDTLETGAVEDTTQANDQLSQWESTCRWCCAARHDQACNLNMDQWYSSPFATQCGAADMSNETAGSVNARIAAIADVNQFYNCGGTDCTNADGCDSGSGCIDHAGSPQDKIDGATGDIRGIAASLDSCATSTGQWSGGAFNGEFRFFKPYSLSDVAGTANNGAGVEWIHSFVKTAMSDLAGSTQNPVTGEGRNSMGMDKFKHRGNQYAQGGFGAAHRFEHQSDLPSQENRDFFDTRKNE